MSEHHLFCGPIVLEEKFRSDEMLPENPNPFYSSILIKDLGLWAYETLKVLFANTFQDIWL